MKLSKAQEKALSKMEVNVDYTAYDLQCSLVTLYAMRRKGAIKRVDDTCLGSFTFPRTAILWRIIDQNE